MEKRILFRAGLRRHRGSLGVLLTFDKLADTSENSELCFRPIQPALETWMYVIWKKYQVFTPIAELLLQQLKQSLGTTDITK